MKFWKSAVSAIALIGAVGCSDPAVVAAKKAEENGRKAVLANLKDPDSAKFGEFVKAKGKKGGTVACLTVNAKNSMGGYTGNQQAALTEKDGKWQVVYIMDIAQIFCLSALQDSN